MPMGMGCACTEKGPRETEKGSPRVGAGRGSAGSWWRQRGQSLFFSSHFSTPWHFSPGLLLMPEAAAEELRGEAPFLFLRPLPPPSSSSSSSRPRWKQCLRVRACEGGNMRERGERERGREGQ